MATAAAASKVTSKQLKDLAGRVGDVRGQLEQVPTLEQLASYRQSLSAQLFGIQGELEKAAK